MIKNKYLIINSNNEIIIKEGNPYMNLFFAVFNCGSILERFEQPAMEYNINSVLDTLTIREEKILRMKYGLNPENKLYSMEEIAAEFNVTELRINQILRKGLRKLKNPSRSLTLLKKRNKYNLESFTFYHSQNNKWDQKTENIPDYDDTDILDFIDDSDFVDDLDLFIDEDFEINCDIHSITKSSNVAEINYIFEFEQILKHEIRNKLLNKLSPNIYLDNILKRIELTTETKDILQFKNLFKGIDELNFSVGTYNCLHRAGIKDLFQLSKLSDEDLIGIRNLGKKQLNEVKEKSKHHCSIIDCSPILKAFIENDTEGLQKIFDSDNSSYVAEQIFYCIAYNNQKSIFKLDLSPKLASLLLTKGYLYQEDILSNIDNLIIEFNKFGLEECSDELKICFSFNDSSQCFVYPLSTKLYKHLKKCQIYSYDQLLESINLALDNKLKMELLYIQNCCSNLATKSATF